MKPTVAIVGVGEVPHGRFPDRTSLDMALSSSAEAIAHAGITAKDVDAVLVAPAFADTRFNIEITFGRLVEELGMRDSAQLAVQVSAGGSSGERMFRMARGLIESGQARFVLCTHADKFSEIDADQITHFFAAAGFDSEFEIPYGLTYNSIGSLAAIRYFHETGATEEHVAHMASSLREWGSIKPTAKNFGKPMSAEQILQTPVLQWPIRTAMAPPPADGSSAFVVASAADAAALRDRAAYLWADASRMRTYSFMQHDDVTRMGWAEVGAEALREAGLTTANIDIAQLYMAYPILHLLLLEELGFCDRGGAGDFVMAGETRPGGRLPVMTNGDALGNGHTGAGVGVATIVESARQLMGEAGDRQVPDVEFILETSAGGSYMDANVSILGREAR